MLALLGVNHIFHVSGLRVKIQMITKTGSRERNSSLPDSEWQYRTRVVV